MRRFVLAGIAAVAACLGCAKVDVDEPRPRRHRRMTPLVEPPPRRRGRDAYEPNNKRERPSPIALGRIQYLTIDPEEDEDWLVCPTPHPGRYVVEFPHVSVALKVEVWLLGRDPRAKGSKVASFEVKRPGSRHVRVPPRAEHIKLKVQAEDDDDTGPYSVTVYPR